MDIPSTCNLTPLHSAVVCNTCSAAFAPDGGPLKACAGCQIVSYCSEEHQTYDWKRHKPLCRTLSARRSNGLSSAISLASSQSSGNSSGSTSGGTASATAANEFSPLIIPAEVLHDPTALAAFFAQQQQQQQQQQHQQFLAAVTGNAASGDVTALGLSIEQIAAAMAAAGTNNSSTTTQASLLDQVAMFEAASRRAALVIPPAPSTYSTLSSLLSSSSQTGGTVLPPSSNLPPLFPPLFGSISALGLQGPTTSSLPHPSSFPHPNALADPPTGIAAPRRRASDMASAIMAATSSQPKFDLGASETTNLMASTSSSPSTSAVANRVKAVPRPRVPDSPAAIARMNRERGGQQAGTPVAVVPSSSASSSTSTLEHKTSSGNLFPSHIIPPSATASSPEKPQGSRKRGTPSPPDAVPPTATATAVPKVMLPPAGVAVTPDDDDIQVIKQTINKRYKDHTKNVIYNVSLREHQRDLMNRGCVLNSHQAMVLRLRYMAEHVIRALNEFGWAVVDNFLGPDHVKFAAKELEKLYEKGLFTAGQVMETKLRDENTIKDIRSDFIYWYDGIDERANEAHTVRLLISMIDSLIMHFENRIEGHRIGGRSRAMLAIYPGNSTRYVKHVDNPNKDGRLITCIYYCNPDWSLEKHGGALRVYPDSCQTAMDIDPQADRLVFFWSDRRNPHEVMPVHRHRFAVTIWYMDKDERTEALKKNEAKDRETLDKSPVEAKMLKKPKSEPDDEVAALSAMVTRDQLNPATPSATLRPSHSSAPEMGMGVSPTSSSPNPMMEAGRLAAGVPDSGIESTSNMSLSRSANNLHQANNMPRPPTDRDIDSDDEDLETDEATLPPPPTDGLEYQI